METLFYLDQIRKERQSELSKEVKSTRPFSNKMVTQTHQPGLVKRSVDWAVTTLIDVIERIKYAGVYRKVESSPKPDTSILTR